ncbi:MAG: SDR family NAD(P)-dependent oxidoreductase [Gammaproteobacteria bacterium]|nr:SDR family NAD(P)-dependent oxidoreductase [Gammaproteobacteria bacterium]
MQDVTGKVAFITGGASGMGLAMARSFSAAGMKVVIADIEDTALAAVAEEFAATNADVLTLKVDVTDRAAMEQAAQATEDAFGKVHVVCNNAGVAVGGSIVDMTYEDWDWVMKVNLDGVINGIQTFVNRIRAHGEGGHIINTASIAGHMAIPSLSVYNTTKFAVVGMSEAIRHDLAPHNIGVSVLCPGVVNTGIFDSGRNRPEQLTGERDTAALVLNDGDSEEERAQRLAAMVDTAMDPAVVGDMVLDAILNNDEYIFTHPNFAEATEGRSAAMQASFDRWAKYREEHGV